MAFRKGNVIAYIQGRRPAAHFYRKAARGRKGEHALELDPVETLRVLPLIAFYAASDDLETEPGVPYLGSALPDHVRERVKVSGEDGPTAWDVAGREYNAKTTIYFLPGGGVRTGNEMDDKALRSLPIGTCLLVGYVPGGRITARHSAFDICGSRWNLRSTYYGLTDGALVNGLNLDEHAIPKGAQVFLAH